MSCAPIDRFAAAEVTIHDTGAALGCLVIWVDYLDGEAPELAYIKFGPTFDNTGFQDQYSSKSTIAANGTDYDVELYRIAGYRGGQSIRVHTKVMSTGGDFTEIYCDIPITEESLLVSSGDGVAISVDDTGEPYPLACVTNHSEEALDRLLKQFCDSTRLRTLLRQLIDQLQEAEDAFWQMFAMRDIDTAADAFLDDFGQLLSDPRGGRTDTAYRASLKGQVLVIKSEGTLADLLGIIQAIIGPSFPVTVNELGRATLCLFLTDPITQAQALSINGKMQKAKAAGVNVFTKYTLTALTNAFTLAPGDVVVTSTLLGLANDGQTTGGHLIDVLGFGD